MGRNSILNFKNLPNSLTILRIICTPILMYGLLIGWNKEVLVVATLIVMVTDFLDGFIARKYKLESNFGKLMDPMADKILVFGYFTIFLIQGNLLLISFLIVLFREFLVSSVRMLALESNRVIPADFFGKLKTNLQYALIIIVLVEQNKYIYIYSSLSIIQYIAGGVELLMVITTIISAVNYTYKYLKIKDIKE